MTLYWDAEAGVLTGQFSAGGRVETVAMEPDLGQVPPPPGAAPLYRLTVYAGKELFPDDGQLATIGPVTFAQPGAGIDIDDTPPDLPLLTLSESSPHAHRDGTTLFYNPAAAGSFTLSATGDDADSGIDGMAFPALFGGGRPATGRRRSRSPTPGAPGPAAAARRPSSRPTTPT